MSSEDRALVAGGAASETSESTSNSIESMSCMDSMNPCLAPDTRVVSLATAIPQLGQLDTPSSICSPQCSQRFIGPPTQGVPSKVTTRCGQLPNDAGGCHSGR